MHTLIIANAVFLLAGDRERRFRRPRWKLVANRPQFVVTQFLVAVNPLREGRHVSTGLGN